MGTNWSTCNCNKDENEIEIVTNDSTKKTNQGKTKAGTLVSFQHSHYNKVILGILDVGWELQKKSGFAVYEI